MRYHCVLGLAFLACLPLGCKGTRPTQSTSWRTPPPVTGLESSDMVQFDVALVEVPPGDRFVNGGLWAFVDEHVMPLETKAQLDENGFRVGHVGAAPPSGLLELLTEKRTCPAPRRIQICVGQEGKWLSLGAPREHCCFRLRQGEQLSEVELHQASLGLHLAPDLTADGQTRVVFTPQVKHAQSGKEPWRVREDGAGWEMQREEAQRYSSLSWELKLKPGEFVVLGTRYDSPDTLGHECFLRTDEVVPVQRLLVIRALRSTGDKAEQPLPMRSKDERGWPPPLAVQASFSSVRGVSP